MVRINALKGYVVSENLTLRGVFIYRKMNISPKLLSSLHSLL